MKLEFAPDVLSEELREELDLDGYIGLFEMDLPIIPHLFAAPLKQKDGRTHFNTLSRLHRLIEKRLLDPERIMEALCRLPDLTYIWADFAEAELSRPHIFELGQFVRNESTLQEYERQAGREADYDAEGHRQCQAVLALLQKSMSPDLGELLLNKKEQNCLKTIDRLQEKIGSALSAYEKQICDQTGLKMIYPYPRELIPADNTADDKPNNKIDRLQTSPLIRVSEGEAVVRIDYRLPESIKAMFNQKESLDRQFEEMLETRLATINQQLKPFYLPLKEIFANRQKKAYHYALLMTQKRHGLCLPELQKEIGIHIQQGELPVLKARKGDAYVPLSLDLTQGASVLFGANMSGKTTVLKTLYFHVMLISCGLPVPAQTIKLNFPKEAAFHLKSSGDLKKGLSGFGLEMNFLEQPFRPGAFIFSDELLQSTDPENGGFLSRLFLEYFAQRKCTFLCTSHYKQITALKNIAVFKMKSCGPNPQEKAAATQKTVLKGTTFEPERMVKPGKATLVAEMKKPLQMALQFSLPESIREEIRKRIEGK